jgi:plasmid stability protein
MANLTIHNLDESIANNLSMQAQQHGQSVEDEARQILRLAFSDTAQKASGLGSKITKRFKEVGGVELPLPIHSQPRQSADFGETN